MKHLIIDANNIANVAFYRASSVLEKDDPGFADTQLHNFTITVFLNIFHKYLKENADYKIYLVWDARNGTAWRKAIYPNYKAGREQKTTVRYQMLYDAMSSIKQLLSFYPVYQLEVPDSEADDIIYSLTSVLEGTKKIISSDEDLVQIAQRFENTKIWHPMTKKYREIPTYDIALFKAICGDPSDGINGLMRFGPKKTVKAIEENLASLDTTQKEIVETNLRIVDLALNPSKDENKKQIESYLASYTNGYSFEKIQSFFIEKKQKQHFSNADGIKKLLNAVIV